MDIELPDPAEFLTRLSASAPATPSLWDSRISDRGSRYALCGRVDAAEIRIDVVRIPPRSGFFVFAPPFEGGVTADGHRLHGRFRVPLPFLLMSAGLLLWVALVAAPTVLAATRGAYPGTAFLDNVAPVLGGAVLFLALTVFAVRQYRGNQRLMTRVLRDAAGSGEHRPRTVR